MHFAGKRRGICRGRVLRGIRVPPQRGPRGPPPRPLLVVFSFGTAAILWGIQDLRSGPALVVNYYASRSERPFTFWTVILLFRFAIGAVLLAALVWRLATGSGRRRQPRSTDPAPGCHYGDGMPIGVAAPGPVGDGRLCRKINRLIAAAGIFSPWLLTLPRITYIVRVLSLLRICSRDRYENKTRRQ